MSERIMQMCGISKKFSGVTALDGIDLDIFSGEIHSLLGENGAGKSTLMNILSGVYPQTSGDLFWNGQKIRFRSASDAKKVGIAMIHQELSLAPHLSVMENIFIGNLARNGMGLVDYAQLERNAAEQLERVRLDPAFARKKVSDLSVSQQQMVEIAKALALHAKLLIMDEPTSCLTARETDILLDIMRKLRDEGVSIIFISHRMEEVFSVSDRLTVLRDGRSVASMMCRDANVNQVLSLMVGREYSNTKVHRCCADYSAQPILSAENVCYKNVVKGVSFQLYPSEVLTITGLVGSGRSELIETICGDRKIASGKVTLCGEDVTGKSSGQMLKRGVSLVPEGRKIQGIFPQMSVEDNMRISSLGRYTSKAGILRVRQIREEVEKQVSDLRVKTPSLAQLIRYLSGGNQQKVILGRCLMCRPRVLILDEPTNGIDVGTKQEIYKIIDQLAREGVSIICISSEMAEVMTISDRIMVMHEGRVTGMLTNDDSLTQDDIMRHAAGNAE